MNITVRSSHVHQALQQLVGNYPREEFVVSFFFLILLCSTLSLSSRQVGGGSDGYDDVCVCVCVCVLFILLCDYVGEGACLQWL